MKPEVYLETSFISYLTARLSHDLIVAGRQQITKDWWESRRDDFDLFVSQTVVEETGEGNEMEARERLDVIEELSILETEEEAVFVADALIRNGPLPENAELDALHIATATAGEMDYLLTWNLKHIANAAMRNKMDQICRSMGYEPVVACTPEELMEEA